MSHDHSVILAVPAANKAEAESYWVKMGSTGNEYSVKLSADGNEPPSHYGLHTWMTAADADMWQNATEISNLTAEETASLRSFLLISVRHESEGTPLEHFAAFLATHGLVRVREGDDV